MQSVSSHFCLSFSVPCFPPSHSSSAPFFPQPNSDLKPFSLVVRKPSLIRPRYMPEWAVCPGGISYGLCIFHALAIGFSKAHFVSKDGILWGEGKVRLRSAFYGLDHCDFIRLP